MKDIFRNLPSDASSNATGLKDEIDVQKHWLVLKRHWNLIAITTAACTTLAGLYALRQPKVYQANGKLVIKADRAAQLTGIDAKTGEIKALTQKSDPLSTEIEILKSQPVLESAANTLQLKDKQGNPIDAKALAKHLSAKPITGTDVLQVIYKSEQPEVAAKIVNQVMEAYLSNNMKVNQAQAEQARTFIDAELHRKALVVRQAEENLRRFRENNGIVALEKETEESIKNMALLSQNIESSTALLSQAEAKVARLRGQIGMDVDSALLINALNQSEAVQKGLQDWRLAQAELAKQRTLYQDGTSEIRLLEDQVEAAQSALQEQIQGITGQQVVPSIRQLQLSETQQELVTNLAEAEVEAVSVRQGLSSLVKSRSQLMEKSRATPALEATQRELQRQVDAAQETYKTLLTKLQEVQVAENQDVKNARIISGAIVPDMPTGLNMWLLLLGGGLAGILLGISLAFLADHQDESVKTPGEAQNLLPYPVLGMIPQMEGNLDSDQAALPHLLTQDYPDFAAQEAYQMLQANLRFLANDWSARSIVVTSTARREGKSTIAANLAVAMAQGQRRVLLVDADMRYGCQHHVWQLNHSVGLSNLLVGQVTMEEAIVTVRSNLHILTRGTLPPNPLALLDSISMASLVERLTERYDFVIFDAPSLLGTADSTVLNRMVDGSLLVMRLGITNRNQIKIMHQLTHQSRQQILGMVMNGLEGDSDPNAPLYPKHRDVGKWINPRQALR